VLETLSSGIKPPEREVCYTSHLLPRLIMSNATHPLPICLHGIHRDNFTKPLLFYIRDILLRKWSIWRMWCRDNLN
jgi:hypothetical protein